MATNDKYDRQLRLWGAKGQRALGSTKVILVGASAAGTETLKNLVLPGVGSFCVMDEMDAMVTAQDASSNFFLPTVGKPKAQVAAQYLQELNSDVQGSHEMVEGRLSSLSAAEWKRLMEKQQSSKDISLLVVASDLEPPALRALSQVCGKEQLQLPLVVVHSYGLMGLVRLQLAQAVALLDPKPTNSHPDLRLNTSFPGLDQLANSIDLATLENHQHGHIPYPILLYKVLQEWKSTHNGQLPTNFVEKQDFVQLVKSKSRDYDKELNFQEAVQNAYLAYAEPEIDTTTATAATSSRKLALLYQALGKFRSEHQGRAPLHGAIPDMTADTDRYVQLQGVYKVQADQDWKAFRSICGAEISDEDVTTFCANLFHIDQMQTRSLVEEYQESPPPEDLIDEWKMALMDPYEVPEHTPILWYLGLRACQEFYDVQGRFPGCIEEGWESDVVGLTELYSKMAQFYRLDDQELVQTHTSTICQELTRYANAEIHNIASVVGGVASQEVVKLITGQYIPLKNTYVYNGIASVAGVYEF